MEVFEEQEIESTTQKPQDLEALRWWYLHHPRSQLCRLFLTPSQQSAAYHPIHHGNKIAFLDLSVTREPDRRQFTSFNREPTHTDQRMIHPQSVKRSVVKRCMTERSVLWQNHQLSLRKRNICHQFLFQTVVPPPLYRRLRNQETPPPPPRQWVCDAVQVHSGFSPCKRWIRASSPLHTTTRHPHSIQVRHDT